MDAVEAAWESYAASKALTKQIQRANNGHSPADERTSSNDDNDDDRARGCGEGQQLAFQIKNATKNVNGTRLDVLL